MPYNSKKSINELWAVVDENNKICLSRGGSSSKPKIMVYEKESTAKVALCSPWIKQIIDVNKVKVIRIYHID